MSTSAAPAKPPRARSSRRRWLFRLLAVALGLSLFGLFEAVCVVFDWGRPADYDDPFVGFHNVHPLFALDASGRTYETAVSRREFFARDEFPARKAPGTFRAFCFGGSTVLGHPYWLDTSFTTYLRLALEAAEPDRTWEVVNCGGVSYASYRLVPILEECRAYQPDLFIICTGHNEFLEERTYGEIKAASGPAVAVRRALSRLRSFTLLRQALLGLTGRSPQSARERQKLKTEVDALLDYREGLKAYHRDERWRTGVIAHYEFNVRRMIDIARDAGVPVILVLPPSNLSDSPPFKSEHRAGLSEAERRRWQALVDQARGAYASDLDRGIALLRQAAAIDDQHAGLWYELGKCCETQAVRKPFAADDWLRQARDAFVAARDLDICPLRILTPMEQALVQVAEDTGTPLLNAHELLERESRTGILGGELLVDHVHPSPDKGHPLIASALATEMERQGFVELDEGWAERRDAIYRAQFEALDQMYFIDGQRRLKALEAWTRGEADGPHIDKRVPAAISDEDWRN